MALTTVTGALAQLNVNLLWEGDPTAARAALEAVRFLKVNRPMESGDGELKMSFEALGKMEGELAAYLNNAGQGVGRSRFTMGKAKYG